MIRNTVLCTLLALALTALGCEKKSAPEAVVQVDAEMIPDIPEPDGGLAEPVAEAESTADADAILEQMKAAGLTAEGFKKVGARYGAKNCIEGTLDTIPTILCEYADAEAAKANRDKAEAFAQGMSTGVVDRNGRTVMAVKADKTLDKNGAKVNKIISQFNKAK